MGNPAGKRTSCPLGNARSQQTARLPQKFICKLSFVKPSNLPIEEQFREIAKAMAAENVSFSEAARELKLDFTAKECELVSRRKDFKRILREEKYKLAGEIANTPGRNKSTAIGMMQHAIEQLMLAGEYDKVISGIEKLAKLEGWMGSDSNINIFAGLTAKEIAEQKEKLLAEINPPQSIKGSQVN